MKTSFFLFYFTDFNSADQEKVVRRLTGLVETLRQHLNEDWPGLEDFVDHYKDIVWKTVCGMVDDEDHRWDCFQEVFKNFFDDGYRTLRMSIEQPEGRIGYLIKTVKNICRNYLLWLLLSKTYISVVEELYLDEHEDAYGKEVVVVSNELPAEDVLLQKEIFALVSGIARNERDQIILIGKLSRKSSIQIADEIKQNTGEDVTIGSVDTTWSRLCDRIRWRLAQKLVDDIDEITNHEEEKIVLFEKSRGRTLKQIAETIQEETGKRITDREVKNICSQLQSRIFCWLMRK
jgi:hypothetical protein